MAQVALRKIVKTFDRTPAVQGIDLDIADREFIVLVGPSGSGKSTFLRLVLKEERPSQGHVYVAGKDLNKLNNWKVPHLRRRIVFLQYE